MPGKIRNQFSTFGEKGKQVAEPRKLAHAYVNISESTLIKIFSTLPYGVIHAAARTAILKWFC